MSSFVHTNAEHVNRIIARIRKASGTAGDIVMLSGGFDPIHSGHLAYIQAARYQWPNALIIVVVNGDRFLTRKKGFAFQRVEERCAIVQALRAVDEVVGYESHFDHVAEMIRLFKPTFFCNGGDRSDPLCWNKEELDACEEVGTLTIGGLGGSTKLNSSSRIVEAVRRQPCRK